MLCYRSLFFNGLGWVRVALAAAICVALGIALPAPHIAVVPAHAACAPDSTPAVDVVCTGTDTDGYQVPAPGINNLVIEQGARVTGATGIVPVAVINGITTTVATFTNNGTIEAIVPNRGGVLVSIVTAGNFINTGTIIGSGLANSVTIGSFLDGGIENSGLISGGGGIQITGDLSFLNNTGIINADLFDGVIIDGTIGSLSNIGLIQGPDDAIEAITISSMVNSGTIFAGDDGVDAATISMLSNSGLIDGLENGINAGLVTSLTNSGTIFGGSDAISALDIGTVINTGTLEGGRFEGVFAINDIGLLINSGVIFGGDDAVQASNISSLVNYGLIDGLEDGIDVDGGTSTNDPNNVIGSIVNHGTIRGDDDGIDVGTLTRLINTGSIIGDFDPNNDGSGIAAAVITEIINSGLIMTGGDISGQHAIEERTTGDTNLSLNAGSVLIGLIDLGGGINVLNIGSGRSINSRFDSDDGIATLPVLGTLAGHLVAFDGTATRRQIVAVDQSAFLGFDDALHALVSGLGQTTQTRQRALRSNPTLGFVNNYTNTDSPQLDAFAAFSDAPLFDPNRFWIEAFGSYRQDQSDRTGNDFDHLTGGLVAGVDVPLDPTTTLGVMAGFARAKFENEISTQENEATSFFAGVYGSISAMGLAWDASLTAGYTAYDQARETANNLVASGLETARADYGGWFITPQVTATRQADNPLAGQSFNGFTAGANLEQSLNLSYAGLFLDGYTETGTTNPLTLNDRTIHLASARATLALPFERVEANGATTTLRVTGGVEARTQFGDDTVSGTLLGQTVSTTLDDDDFSAGAFVGLSGDYETTGGLTAYANVEAMIENDASWQMSLQAGLRIRF